MSQEIGKLPSGMRFRVPHCFYFWLTPMLLIIVIRLDERVGKDGADYQDGNVLTYVLVLGFVSFTHSGAAAAAG